MPLIPCIQTIRLGEAGYSVAWSPDGTRLAVGDNGQGVSVWSLDGRRLWERREHGSGETRVVRWSPDARQLASGNNDGEAILWSATDGEVVWKHTGRRIVWDLSWSPDAMRIAHATVARRYGDVEILNARTGEIVRTLQGHMDYVHATAWSPDGQTLASVSTDSTLRLWDPHAGILLQTLGHEKDNLWAVAFSPDGGRVFSAGQAALLHCWDSASGKALWTRTLPKAVIQQWSLPDDGTLLAVGRGSNNFSVSKNRGPEIHLYSTDDGHQVAVLEGHGDDVMGCSFEPGGTRLASVSWDQTLRIWDCAALLRPKAPAQPAAAGDWLRRQVATLGRRPPPEPLTAASRLLLWLPRGLPRTASDEGQALPHCIGLFETSARPGALPSLALSPDGRRLATGSSDGHVRLWDLSAGPAAATPLWTSGWPRASGIPDVAFSPDGRRLASAGADNQVLIRDDLSGDMLTRLEGHTIGVQQAAWSPDGRRLATASQDSSLRLWDPDSGECLARLEGHEDRVFAVAWSPDGRLLASGGDDRILRLWEPDSGRALRRLEGHQGLIGGVAFSPDSRRLLSASGDGEKELRLWDPSNGHLLRHWPSHEAGELATPAIWSPDGRLLASAPNRKDSGLQEQVGIRVWDADSGRLLTCFPFPESYCWRLAWSPDGAFLASSQSTGPDGMDRFRLWDTRDLFPVGVPQALDRTGTGIAAKTARAAAASAEKAPAPLPADLAHLPAQAATLARLGRCPPLSLLRELGPLLSGAETNAALRPLSTSAGVRGLRRLRWPRRAQAGLLALLLDGLDLSPWHPPAELPPSRIRAALERALGGEEIAPEETFGAKRDPPPELPIDALTQAAARIDERLLGLLALVGADAVATDPGLALRLVPQARALPPRALPKRALLGLRLRLDGEGTAQGTVGGIGNVGISNHGSLNNLLPTQLALPKRYRRLRWLRQELLYRARQGQEPPRLRPTVLVLDVSPPVWGPVEAITRLAAQILATSLMPTAIPLVLVTLGGAGSVSFIQQRPDLVQIWTSRSLAPADLSKGLARAMGMARTIQDGPLPPVVLLLSHVWVGAEATDLPRLQGLRALFVQYPGETHTPPLARHCEHWASLPCARPDGQPPPGSEPLEEVLAKLLV